MSGYTDTNNVGISTKNGIIQKVLYKAQLMRHSTTALRFIIDLALAMTSNKYSKYFYNWAVISFNEKLIF